MANTIRLRRGSGVPSAASFVVGEPAWDQTGNKLYVKNAAGVMVEIGSPTPTDYGLITDAVTASFDYGALV
jgi:hypothetical protein